MADKVEHFCNAAFIIIGAILIFLSGVFSTSDRFNPMIVALYFIAGVFLVMARVRYDDDEEEGENEE
jgi:hypothetical membrane protein